MPCRFFDRLIRRVSDVIKTLIVSRPRTGSREIGIRETSFGERKGEESVEPGCEIAFIAEG